MKLYLFELDDQTLKDQHRREVRAAWARKNRDRLNAKKREYRRLNHTRVLEQERARRARNPTAQARAPKKRVGRKPDSIVDTIIGP